MVSPIKRSFFRHDRSIATVKLIKNSFLRLQTDDSTGTKLAGSVINALIFVVIVGLMTFVLVLLFKYGVKYTGIIIISTSLDQCDQNSISLHLR